MYRFVTYLFIFLSFCSFSQVEFKLTKHDFGSLEPYSPRYVDFVLTNKGSKQEWVLSVKKPAEVVYIPSKQIIDKDSSVVLRLQVNPTSKGKFSYQIEVYTSDRDEPVKLKLTGNLSELPQDGSSAFTACPSFSDRPGGRNPNNFDLTVVTIDKETKQELSSSTVSMIQNGREQWTKRTDRKGKINEDATIGLSYFYATHEGYNPAELGAYVNFKRNYVVLELERKEEEIIPPVIIPETPDTLVASSETTTQEIEIEIQIEEHIEPTTDLTEIAQAPPSLTDLDKDNFDPQYFNPINVVFVLDISSSMKQVDKMELMKYSLNRLTDLLRAQDKIGLVTYSSYADVLLPPTSGGDKNDIIEKVEDLEAFGYTAGGTGIKLGFKQAKKGYIQNGVNHVVIITDGAFNRNSDDYKRYVKRYTKKGIHFSVVGIKNKPNDEDEMREAAELGQGHYVPIFGLSDAQENLRQMVRLLTYKE